MRYALVVITTWSGEALAFTGAILGHANNVARPCREGLS
jgi:hypothetical protein